MTIHEALNCLKNSIYTVVGKLKTSYLFLIKRTNMKSSCPGRGVTGLPFIAIPGMYGTSLQITEKEKQNDLSF